MDNETRDILQQILQGQQRTEVRFDKLEGRFDTLEGRFDTLEGRFDTLEGRFDTLEGRFDTLEGTVSNMAVQIDKLNEITTRTAVIQENTISNKLQLIYENQISIIESNKKYESQATRIEALEADVFALKYAFKSFQPN